MPVVDAGVGDLDSPADLMRWFTDELQTNHRFTNRYGDVSGTGAWNATDTLRWMDRPQAETFYNDSDIAFGIRETSDTRGEDTTPLQLGLQVSHEVFATWDPAAGNRWDDNDMVTSAIQYFPPSISATPASSWGSPCGVNGLDVTPFIRARLVTSPTSTSATPSEPLYFYVVAEGATGIYTIFGFGEICKEEDWSGGVFCAGHIWSNDGAANFYNAQNSLFGSGYYAGNDHTSMLDEGSHYVYAPGWTGIADTNAAEGRGWCVGQSIADPGGGPVQTSWPALGWDPRGPLSFMQHSPSGFSLQSHRMPAVLWGANGRLDDAVGFELYPMGVFPDLFQAVITDVDAYGVFQDTAGDNYMVVPYRNKTISENAAGGSGRFGLLIRNPALTPTI